MTRRWTVISCLAALGAGLAACSSSPSDDTGGGGSSGSSSGSGGTATGGTAGAATGGTATGGTATGGTTSGTGGGAGVGTECKGIKSGGACTTIGQECPTLVCGLADQGSRSCNCVDGGTGMGTWMCTSCDFTNAPDWFKNPPMPIPMCPADAADENPCVDVETICGPVGSEYCACWNSPSDGVSWDCDSRPSIWPM